MSELTTGRIGHLEEAMLTLEAQYGLDPDIGHTFATEIGLYARTMSVPAGTSLVGKKHRYECINIISKGHALVVTDVDELEVEGPLIFVSPAGTKRAIYAVTDLVWTTVHRADTTDLDELEKELIE